MELLIFKRTYNQPDAIHNFMDVYHSLNMTYLASDLLDKGLTAKQISEAVVAAIKLANASKINTKAHFKPVFSGLKQGVIEDCKLSQLGYGLVLLNADSKLSVVADFQVDVLQCYLDKTR